MSQTNYFVLEHNKNIVYLQIFSAMIFAIWAAQIFGVFETRIVLLGKGLLINNFAIGLTVGIIGGNFFRIRLRGIARQIKELKE